MCDSLPITVAPVLFSGVGNTIPTSTNDPGYVYVYETAAVLPIASGIIPKCYKYEDASNWTSLCRFLAWRNEISLDQLVAWNPSLDANRSSCVLDPTHSYCVLQYENSTSTGTRYIPILVLSIWL
jgi:hypothetical protein